MAKTTTNVATTNPSIREETTMMIITSIRAQSSIITGTMPGTKVMILAAGSKKIPLRRTSSRKRLKLCIKKPLWKRMNHRKLDSF